MPATAQSKRQPPEQLAVAVVFRAGRPRLVKTMELQMRKIATVILLSASLLAAACNTVKGAGQDIESVGDAADRAI